MTDRPKVVMVKLNQREMETLLAEQALAHQAELEAARESVGTLRVSWELLHWAKAQMIHRPH